MTLSLGLSAFGFGLSVAGVYLNWGAGWAALTGGVVLFVVGGLLAREGRDR